MNKEQVLQLASDLVGDGSNEEYTRGIAELIAYMYPVENELPTDRVEQITNELTAD